MLSQSTPVYCRGPHTTSSCDHSRVGRDTPLRDTQLLGILQFETLGSGNIAELQFAVPSRCLTKTFVDANQITRAVVLTYLWIDSLCIIQDSKEDWEVEANTMASVYGGSFLNIAASSARDGTEDCFLKPQYHYGGFTVQVCINGRMETFDFWPIDEYKKSVTGSYLVTRAWTVQEKVLPTRTLHCSNQGFFWECKTQFASEYFPQGFYSTINVFLRGDSMLLAHSNPWAYWKELKEWYTKYNLTKPGDKLIALSGVIQALQDKTGDQCFAGLWRKTLDQELCWRATDPRQRPEYRAPSWSWAAVDGPVISKLIKTPVLDISYVHVSSVSEVQSEGNAPGTTLHGALSLLCDLVLRDRIAAEDISRTNRMPYSIHHSASPDKARGICFSDIGQEGLCFLFFWIASSRRTHGLVRPYTTSHSMEGVMVL